MIVFGCRKRGLAEMPGFKFISQTGYVYISKGELMIENGELVGGTVEVGLNTIEDKNHRS